jgi:putative membrane protein
MSVRLERTLKGLVLIGLALFLSHSVINGTLLFYINRRFAWLTLVAILLLLLIAAPYRRQGPSGQHHDRGQDHHHAGANVWMGVALVALPLLLGLLVPPRPLGAQAVGVREVNTDGMGLREDDAVLARAAAERNILDWLRAFQAADDPSAFDGQEASVVGFVFRDEAFAADQFMLSRFVVSCCVADATVVGLIVSWPGSVDLPLDTWVEVRGAFAHGQFDGESRSMLIADSVTPTLVPNQPYLYP